MFQRKLRWALPLFVLLGIFVLPQQRYSSNGQVEKPREGGRLRLRTFTLNAFQPQYDPAGNAHVFILDQLFNGLVKLDRNLHPVGDLANYWSVSDDGRRYSFYLRKGVKFHHGRELEAEDVKFSLERLIRRETSGPYYQFFAAKVVGGLEYREGRTNEVEGFKVRDKYTFEIQWKDPYVSALPLLSMYFCKILPRDLVLSRGNGFFAEPKGTGPFKFAYWLRNSRLEIVGVRLERNDDYFDGRPYLDAVEFSPDYSLDQFLDGEVDIIPYSDVRLADKKDVYVVESDSLSTVFLMMSCHLPPLDKASVRRAISLVINKADIAKAVFRPDSSPQVTNNFIPAKLPGFYPADDRQSYDPEEAKQILHEEGLSREGSLPSFILFLQDSRTNEDEKITSLLREQLAGLGIKLKTRKYRTLDEIGSSREPFLAIITWSMDFPDPENIILPLFLSTSGLNLNVLHYVNPKLDELARKAEVERSWTERTALFHKIEDILNEDLPAVPLFSRYQRLAVHSYVRGVKAPPLGLYYLDAKEIWLNK